MPELLERARFKCLVFQTELIRGGIGNPFVQSRDFGIGIDEQADTRQTGNEISEKLQAFEDEIFPEMRQPGHISSRPCKSVDETTAHRVGNEDEHDRY